MAALIGEIRDGVREATEDADREASSEDVGAKRVIFFGLRVASEMEAWKGGLTMPILGVIMNF